MARDRGQSSILDVMADLLADFPAPVRRELHVAEPVWRFLRESYAKVSQPVMTQLPVGLPVVIDGDLGGGQWQIHENGEVASFGDMAPAPEGVEVSYSPITGWIAVRSDLMDELKKGGGRK